MDIKQRGVNLRMSHEVLESGEGDASLHHVRSEGMAKPVRVGRRDLTAQSMMVE